MHIAHLITNLGRGGAENHLHGLIREQIRFGHRVTCIRLRQPDDWEAAIRQAGAEVINLEMACYGDPRPIAHLRSWLRRLAPEVLHAHLQPAEVYGALSRSAQPSCKYITSRHNLDPFYRGPLSKWLEAWATHRADRIIAISSAVEARIRNGSPHYPSNRIDVVPYGADLSVYRRSSPIEKTTIRTSLSLPVDALILGVTARLIETKRIDVLIDAFAELANDFPKLHLAIAGDGPEWDYLRARATVIPGADRIHFLGMRKDVPRVLQAFDLFVFPSVREGFGLSVLEAMAAGLPVVASDIPPITELIDHGKTGFLFPPGNPSALAAALRRAIQGKEISEGIGKAGQVVAEQFNLHTMMLATERVYNQATPGTVQ